MAMESNLDAGKQLLSLLQQAVDSVLSKPDCVVDDTFPDRFVECMELLVENCRSSGCTEINQHNNVTQGMALVQRFVKAAVSSMSTKLLCLGVRILRLCPSLLVSDAVILKGLRSAIVSPLVSLRDAAFITAKRVVEDWPPLGLSETYCPLADEWFVSSAVKALTDSSIFVAASARDFLCTCWLMQCNWPAPTAVPAGPSSPTDVGTSSHFSVVHGISTEAEACGNELSSSHAFESLPAPQIMTPSAADKGRPWQRAATLLGLVASALRNTSDVPLEAACDVWKSSSLFRLVFSVLGRPAVSSVPFSVFSHLVSFIEALCVRTRSSSEVVTALLECGWTPDSDLGPGEQPQSLLLLTIPCQLLARNLPDVATSLLSTFCQQLGSADLVFSSACMLRLTAPVHMAAGVDAALLVDMADSVDLSVDQWLEVAGNVMRKEAPFTKLLCCIVHVLEQLVKVSAPKRPSHMTLCLASALHILASSCSYDGAGPDAESKPSPLRHIYGNEKLAKALCGLFGTVSSHSEMDATLMCTAETSDLPSPLAILIELLQCQQFGVSMTLRLLTAIGNILTGLPKGTFSAAMEDDCLENASKRHFLPVLSMPGPGMHRLTHCTAAQLSPPNTVNELPVYAPDAPRYVASYGESSAHDADCLADGLGCRNPRDSSAPCMISSSSQSAGACDYLSNCHQRDQCTATTACAQPSIAQHKPTPSYVPHDAMASATCPVYCPSVTAETIDSSSTGVNGRETILAASMPTSQFGTCLYVGSSAVGQPSECPVNDGVIKEIGSRSSVCYGLSSGGICSVARRLACYMRTATYHRDWEVRDSALTLGGLLLNVEADCWDSHSFVKESDFFSSLWRLLNDGSAFVRGSALQVMSIISRQEGLLTVFLQHHHIPKESFASIVLLLLLHDAEEFPRRSAASVLCAWLGQSTMQPVLVPTAHNPERHDYQNVQAVPIDKDSVNEHADMVHWTTADNLGCVALSCDRQLRICSSATDTGKWNHSPLERHCCSRREQQSALINSLKDFDWEVKRTMLRFFSDLLTLCAEDRSGKAITDILSWMCVSGCSSVVVGLTEDCDSAVADAAIAFVSRVNRAVPLLATKMEATAGGDDGDDIPLSAGAVDVTSLSNFLKWCLRFESHIVQEKAADHWSHVLTLAGFEPLSFLADIIHGAAMPATNEEDKVIVDCY